MGHRLILSREGRREKFRSVNRTSACSCHEALWYPKPSELHYVATQVLTSVNILGTATGKEAVCAKRRRSLLGLWMGCRYICLYAHVTKLRFVRLFFYSNSLINPAGSAQILILQVCNKFQQFTICLLHADGFVCIPPWLKNVGLHNVCYSGVRFVLDRIYVGAGWSHITGRILQTKHIQTLPEPCVYHCIYLFLLSPFFVYSAYY